MTTLTPIRPQPYFPNQGNLKTVPDPQEPLTPENILGDAIEPPFLLHFPTRGIQLTLKDLVKNLNQVLIENGLSLKTLKVTGSNVRKALCGESLFNPPNNKSDLDFLGILDGNLEDRKTLERLFIKTLERAFGISCSTNAKVTTHTRRGQILGKTFEDEPSIFERKDKKIIEPIYSDDFGLTVRLPFAERPVDFTLRWEETANCISSADSPQAECLDYFLNGGPLKFVAADGYDLKDAIEDFLKGFFTVILEKIKDIREGLRGYVRLLTQGLRPKDFRYEVEFLKKWIQDYRVENEQDFFTVEIHRYFKKLKNYLRRHEEDFHFRVAYLTNLHSVFSAHNFPGRDRFLAHFDIWATDYLQELQATSEAFDSDKKQEEPPCNSAIWRTLSFWTHIGNNPASLRYDSISCSQPRFWIPLHSGRILSIPPWKDTAELLLNNFQGVEPFLGRFGFPKSIGEIKALLSKRFVQMGFDPRAQLFQWLTTPQAPIEDFTDRFASSLPLLRPEDLILIERLLADRKTDDADPRAALFRWILDPEPSEQNFEMQFDQALKLIANAFPLLDVKQMPHIYRLLSSKKMVEVIGPDPRSNLLKWLIAPQHPSQNFSSRFSQALQLFAQAVPLLTPIQFQQMHQLLILRKGNGLAGPDPRVELFQILVIPEIPEEALIASFAKALPLLTSEDYVAIQQLLKSLRPDGRINKAFEAEKPSLYPMALLQIFFDEKMKIEEETALAAIQSACIGGTPDHLAAAIAIAYSIRSEKIFDLLETSIWKRRDLPSDELIDFYLKRPLNDPRKLLSLLDFESRPKSLEKLERWIHLWQYHLDRNSALVSPLLESPHFTEKEKKVFTAQILKKSTDQKDYDQFFFHFDLICNQGSLPDEAFLHLLAAAKAAGTNLERGAQVLEAIVKFSNFHPEGAIRLLKELPLAWLHQIHRAPMQYWKILQTGAHRPVQQPGLSKETQIPLLATLLEPTLNPEKFLHLFLNLWSDEQQPVLGDFLAFARHLKGMLPVFKRLPLKNPDPEDLLTSISQESEWMKIFFHLMLSSPLSADRHRSLLGVMVLKMTPDQITRERLMQIVLKLGDSLPILCRQKALETALSTPGSSGWDELKENLPALLHPHKEEKEGFPESLRQALECFMRNRDPVPFSILQQLFALDILSPPAIWVGAQAHPLSKKSFPSLLKVSTACLEKEGKAMDEIEQYWKKAIQSQPIDLESLHALYSLPHLSDEYRQAVVAKMEERLENTKVVADAVQSRFQWIDRIAYKIALKAAEQKNGKVLDFLEKNKEALDRCSILEQSALFKLLAKYEKQPPAFQKQLMERAESTLKLIESQNNHVENLQALEALLVDPVLDHLCVAFSEAFWREAILVRNEQPLVDYWRVFKPFLKNPSITNEKAGTRAISITLSKIREDCKNPNDGLRILQELLTLIPEELITAETLETFESLAEAMGPDFYKMERSFAVAQVIWKRFSNIWSLNSGQQGRFKILLINPEPFNRLLDLLYTHFQKFTEAGRLIPLGDLIPFVTNLENQQPGRGRELLVANFRNVMKRTPQGSKESSLALKSIWGAFEFAYARTSGECMEMLNLFNEARGCFTPSHFASSFLSLQIQVLNFMRKGVCPFSEIEKFHSAFLTVYPWLADPKRSELEIDHPTIPSKMILVSKALSLSVTKHMEILAESTAADPQGAVAPALALMDYVEKLHPFSQFADLAQMTFACRGVAEKMKDPVPFFERTVRFTLRCSFVPGFQIQQSAAISEFLEEMLKVAAPDRSEEFFSIIFKAYPWLFDMKQTKIIDYLLSKRQSKDTALAIVENMHILSMVSHSHPEKVLESAMNLLDYAESLHVFTEFNDLSNLIKYWQPLCSRSNDMRKWFFRMIRFVRNVQGSNLTDLEKSAAIVSLYLTISAKLWDDDNQDLVGKLYFHMIENVPGALGIPNLHAVTIKLLNHYLVLSEKPDFAHALKSAFKLSQIILVLLNNLTVTDTNKKIVKEIVDHFEDSGAFILYQAIIDKRKETAPGFAGEAQRVLTNIQAMCKKLQN